MCLLDLLQGKGEEWGTVGMSCTLFGIAVRRCKCGKSGSLTFMDNSIQALIEFKERHKGLLKLHVQLVQEFWCRKKRE